ncbi:hypothetical protein QJQ45_004385 [Haematococcus lacustris]|nr:hypothetical protein QJQ45_004385 [Haematococcus lacustris]
MERYYLDERKRAALKILARGAASAGQEDRPESSTTPKIFLEALNAAHYRHCVPQDGYVHCVAGDAFNKPSSYAGVATRDLEQHTDTYLDRSGLEGAVQQLHGSGQLNLAGAFAAARATTEATGAGAVAAVAAARAAGEDTKQFVYYLLAVALLLRQCCGVLHILDLYIGFACRFQVTWARYAAVLGVNTERVRLVVNWMHGASHNMACQLKNNGRYSAALHLAVSRHGSASDEGVTYRTHVEQLTNDVHEFMSSMMCMSERPEQQGLAHSKQCHKDKAQDSRSDSQ